MKFYKSDNLIINCSTHAKILKQGVKRISRFSRKFNKVNYIISMHKSNKSEFEIFLVHSRSHLFDVHSAVDRGFDVKSN